jgi:5-methylcytosine-specific restriction endonuclease McrA
MVTASLSKTVAPETSQKTYQALTRLSEKEQALHERALQLSQRHRQTECLLIETLDEIDQLKLYRTLGYSSLFTYAVGALGFSEAVAYSFITVARKTRELSLLKEAIQDEKLSVAKASRIISALTPKNANELIDYAATHTTRETDQEVARLGNASLMSEKQVVLKISARTLEQLKRVQSLIATKRKEPVTLDAALELALSDYLKRNDPVEKAKRRMKATEDERSKADIKSEKGEMVSTVESHKVAASVEYHERRPSVENHQSAPGAQNLCVVTKNSVRTEQNHLHSPQMGPGRQALKALEKHAVYLRDGGRCTFVDAKGSRCTSDRWLHIHHIRAVSEGGGNEFSNLALLCSFHHDLVHQLSFAIDGQVSWLRERQQMYVG